ncbi:hypothetical protein [Sulfurimonas sp.]|uniref:hypothetical protein n=1 Tax=Sulfurimonas sp. TaxID=2022749 RepID=UPI003D0E7286
MKKYTTYIAIDDTDELNYHTSTGKIALNIQQQLESTFSLQTSVLTRHQLLMDAKVPYTSHNSAMCFGITSHNYNLEDIKKFIIESVTNQAANSSAPGICICSEQNITNKETFIEYGFDAKDIVLDIEKAFKIAKEQNIFLLGLKENKQGVIGALAAVALRISGNDGALKGALKLQKDYTSYNEIMQYNYFDKIELLDQTSIDTSVKIYTKEGLKALYLNHQKVLLVEKKDDCYTPLEKEKILHYRVKNAN